MRRLRSGRLLYSRVRRARPRFSMDDPWCVYATLNHSEAANASQLRGLHEKTFWGACAYGLYQSKPVECGIQLSAHMRKEGCWRPRGPHCGLVASDTRESARCNCLCRSSVLHAQTVLSIGTMPCGIPRRAGTAQRLKHVLMHVGTRGRFTDRDFGVGSRPDELECRKALLGARRLWRLKLDQTPRWARACRTYPIPPRW